eukprot:gene4940-6157_t
MCKNRHWNLLKYKLKQQESECHPILYNPLSFVNIEFIKEIYSGIKDINLDLDSPKVTEKSFQSISIDSYIFSCKDIELVQLYHRLYPYAITDIVVKELLQYLKFKYRANYNSLQDDQVSLRYLIDLVWLLLDHVRVPISSPNIDRLMAFFNPNRPEQLELIKRLQQMQLLQIPLSESNLVLKSVNIRNEDMVYYINNNWNDKYSFSSKVIDKATKKGLLKLVQFLHSNRTESYTIGAIKYAISYDRLDLVKFLINSHDQFQIPSGSQLLNKLGFGDLEALIKVCLGSKMFEFLWPFVLEDGSPGFSNCNPRGKNQHENVLMDLLLYKSDILSVHKLPILEFLIDQGFHFEWSCVVERCYDFEFFLKVYKKLTPGCIPLRSVISIDNVDLETIKHLVKTGCPTYDSVTVAAYYNRLDIIEFLVSQTDANIQGGAGFAAVRGYIDIVKYLHKNMNDSEIALEFETDTIYKCPHYNIVKYLLEHKLIGTPFRFLKVNNLKMIKLLTMYHQFKLADFFTEKFNPSADLDITLKRVIKFGDLEILKYVYSTYVTPNNKNSIIKELNEYVGSNKLSVEILDFLLEMGVYHGNLLKMAFSKGDVRHLEVIFKRCGFMLMIQKDFVDLSFFLKPISDITLCKTSPTKLFRYFDSIGYGIIKVDPFPNEYFDYAFFKYDVEFLQYLLTERLASESLFNSLIKYLHQLYCNNSESNDSFSIFKHYPGSLGIIQFVAGVGDFMAQKIEGKGYWNKERTVIMSSVGMFFIIPQIHCWFKFLEYTIPGNSLPRTLAKVAIDQIIMSPWMIFNNFTLVQLLNQRTEFNVEQWKSRISPENMFTVIQNSW